MPPTRDEDAANTNPTAPTSHPIGFWFFFWGELAERSSYYGMRAILTLYMINQLHFEKDDAGSISHAFIAGCYLLPLLGGWIADNFFGKYWTIIGFSLPYIIGHVILGFENVPCMAVALVLLAMGSGVIKPNISTLMGLTYDEQRPGQNKLRSDAFAMFYGAINIGAAISSFAVPWIRTKYGYQLAFLFPAALMVVAFFIFAMGKRFYAVEKIERRVKTAEESAAQWTVVGRISGIFAVVTFFWSVFDQSTSTWVLFAEEYLDLRLFGKTLDADMIQGVNPILIVIMLPFVTLFWHWLDRRGIKLRPTDKMLFGFILAVVTMGMLAVAGYMTTPEMKRVAAKESPAEAKDEAASAKANDNLPSAAKASAAGDQLPRPSVLWEIAAYVVITLAEICISVVGLELAFTAAPDTMKSFITACWLFTVFLGNLLAMFVSRLYTHMPPGHYFSLLTVMMIAVGLAFVFVASRFNRQIPAS